MIQVVLTGTAHSGKSTLLEALGREGYKIIPEAETQILNGLVGKWGDKKTREWISQNYFEFKQMVGINQAHLESEVVAEENEIVIYDRTAICWISYCKLRKTDAPPIIRKLADQHTNKNRYQYVFLCSMLSDFDERRKEGRIMTRKEALKLNGLIIDEYMARGYNNPIPVAEKDLDKAINIAYRVDFIKRNLNSSPTSSR